MDRYIPNSWPSRAQAAEFNSELGRASPRSAPLASAPRTRASGHNISRLRCIIRHSPFVLFLITRRQLLVIHAPCGHTSLPLARRGNWLPATCTRTSNVVQERRAAGTEQYMRERLRLRHTSVSISKPVMKRNHRRVSVHVKPRIAVQHLCFDLCELCMPQLIDGWWSSNVIHVLLLL
jgi:hypothetical protein